MEEILIFFNAIEEEATLQLLRNEWSHRLLFYPLSRGAVQIYLDAPVVAFFKWAYTVQAGQVLLHCFNLSLDLLDPPAYMQQALRELQSLKLLSE